MITIEESKNLILDAFKAEARTEEVSDFMKITPESVGISDEHFYAALKKLESEGIISGIIWSEDGACLYDNIQINTKDFCLL